MALIDWGWSSHEAWRSAWATRQEIRVRIRCVYPGTSLPPSEVEFQPSPAFGNTPEAVLSKILGLLETRDYFEVPALGESAVAVHIVASRHGRALAFHLDSRVGLPESAIGGAEVPPSGTAAFCSDRPIRSAPLGRTVRRCRLWSPGDASAVPVQPWIAPGIQGMLVREDAATPIPTVLSQGVLRRVREPVPALAEVAWS